MSRAKYFTAGRSLIDISNCRDLSSLQTILSIVYFLHSSARMSVCHSYIAAASASSLQMGLHRSVPVLDPVERETRKRVFWAVRNMEVYICAISGLPTTIHEEDIDQEMPVEVDDEYITKRGILPMPEGRLSANVAVNAYTKLLMIFSKIMRNVYPVRRRGGESACSYRVGYAVISDIEQDLQRWLENHRWLLESADALNPGCLR